MQVGDYIIQQPYKSDITYFRIFKVLRICIDGYLEVESQAVVYCSLNKHSPLTKPVYSNFNRPIKYITKARIKPYHPTLEELFIFKSFKEQS